MGFSAQPRPADARIRSLVRCPFVARVPATAVVIAAARHMTSAPITLRSMSRSHVTRSNISLHMRTGRYHTCTCVAAGHHRHDPLRAGCARAHVCCRMHPYRRSPHMHDRVESRRVGQALALHADVRIRIPSVSKPHGHAHWQVQESVSSRRAVTESNHGICALHAAAAPWARAPVPAGRVPVRECDAQQ